jgi:hypothetical protein
MTVTGALAWSPQVSMSKEEIDDFLSGRWVARVATNSADGYPVVTPLWYYWDGQCLYFNIARTRLTLKNLARDPRCSAVIDMDDRPLMGMRTNHARAVLIVGDAQLAYAESGDKVRIEAGPFAGEYLAEQALGMITNRYSLTERDGVVGFSRESFGKLYETDEIKESQLFRDNEGRVLVKVAPKKIRAWDFSKAPIGRM